MADEIGKVHSRIDGHEREIGELRGDISALRTSIDHLQGAVEKTMGKLDRVVDAISTKGYANLQQVAQVFQIAVYAAALISGIVAGIVYIAGNAQNADLALLRYRIEQLHIDRASWRAMPRKEASQ